MLDLYLTLNQYLININFSAPQFYPKFEKSYIHPKTKILEISATNIIYSQ